MKQDQECAVLYTTFVTQLLANYIEHPDLLRVEASCQPGRVIISIRPAPTDFGKVIGRERRALSALEVLLNAKAAQDGRTVQINMVEPENRLEAVRAPRPVNAAWSKVDNERMAKLLTNILDQTLAVAAEVIVRPVRDGKKPGTMLTIVPLERDNKVGLNVVAALNTIFRAIAANSGYSLMVNARD